MKQEYHQNYIKETDFNTTLVELIKTNTKIPVQARPFIKWVGGKNGISQKILEYLPNEIENYYEPFLGGGSIFFNARNRIQKAFLSDVNGELILAYKIIRDDVENVIEILKKYKANHNNENYYKLRSMHRLENPIEMVARFIYLNKTCYNGLYRVNNKNEFNVPIGSYKNPNIVDENNLRACSEVLKNINIEFCSFENINIHKNSVVYCDPPYDETYNQYTSNKFNRDMQVKLRDKAIEWSKKGAKVIISNADTEYIRNIYSDVEFIVTELQAPRFVSCKNDGREGVQELLIYST